jgi:hypothetical protein
MITRSHPQFSLCGLNCALCPRYNTTGPSRCQGCGAKNFQEFHPTCAIMTCNNKKEKVAFCFECSYYPCDRYIREDKKDSFISYFNRKKDMILAQSNLDSYLTNLTEKRLILEYLLEHHNDGRSKNFYCLAVNLLEIEDLHDIKSEISLPTETKEVKELILKVAQKRGISIALRK